MGGLKAVLLDAMGTLVALEPPAPLLARELRLRFGMEPTPEQARAAFAAEIGHYRANVQRGAGDGLPQLRRECARVLRAALPPAYHRLDLADVEGAMLASLRFRPFPDAVPALRALRGMGMGLIVCSNWDQSLREMLRRTGLWDFVDGAVASAVAGAAKPDPAIFAAALSQAGAAPGEALHAGDSLADDVAGARAAGLRAAVWVNRGDAPVPDGRPGGAHAGGATGARRAPYAVGVSIAPPPPHVPPQERPSEWPWWAPFVALLSAVLVGGTIGAMIVVAASIVGIADIGEEGDDTPGGLILAGTFVQDIFFIAAAVGFAWLIAGRPSPADFGLRRTRLTSALGWTFAAWAIFLVFSLAYAAALGLEENDDLPQELGADKDTAALIATAVLVCVMAPLAEELLFRGFMFRTLYERWSLVPAILVTGAVFGGVHAVGSEPEFLPALAVLGAALCWLYYMTKSLYPCIALHMVNNAIALAVSLEWDWYWALVTMAGAGAVIYVLVAGDAAPHIGAAVSAASVLSSSAMPPRACAMRIRVAPLPSARIRSTPASASGSGAWGRASASASAATSRSGRIAPSCQSVASSPSREARKEDSEIASRGGSAASPAGSARTHASTSACTSAARPITASSRDWASMARISSVPSFGCGRMSDQRNV